MFLIIILTSQKQFIQIQQQNIACSIWVQIQTLVLQSLYFRKHKHWTGPLNFATQALSLDLFCSICRRSVQPSSISRRFVQFLFFPIQIKRSLKLLSYHTKYNLLLALNFCQQYLPSEKVEGKLGRPDVIFSGSDSTLTGN